MKFSIALKPLHGSLKVAKFLLAISSKRPANFVSQIVQVNNQPGIINYIGDRVRAERRLRQRLACPEDSAGALHHRPYSVMTFDFKDDRIQSVFIVVNPEKLKQLADFKYQLGLTNDIMPG